jgi:sugar lactone lactonase YvrE
LVVNSDIQQLSRHVCDLGEGLHCDTDLVAWVDIHRDELLILGETGLKRHALPVKPSVIFGRKENSLQIGTDQGVLWFDLNTCDYSLADWCGLPHHLEQFRSNDGCLGADFGLLGFMHREDPLNNKGSVCRVNGNQLTLLDKDIHIPNGFVFLDDSHVLICDSLESRIYVYSFDRAGQLIDKILFHQFDSVVTPDGGCLVNNRIWFALWDGGALVCLDIAGNEVERVMVPCIRPTNCKYDSVKRRIVFTSASADLQEDEWQGTTFSLALPTMRVD